MCHLQRYLWWSQIRRFFTQGRLWWTELGCYHQSRNMYPAQLRHFSHWRSVWKARIHQPFSMYFCWLFFMLTKFWRNSCRCVTFGVTCHDHRLCDEKFLHTGRSYWVEHGCHQSDSEYHAQLWHLSHSRNVCKAWIHNHFSTHFFLIILHIDQILEKDV